MEVKQKCVEMEFDVYGKFVFDKGLTVKQKIEIETLAGIKKLVLKVREGKVENVEVDMGEPILEAEKIPVQIQEKELELKVKDRTFSFTCVSMGNPHAITFIEDSKNFLIETYGPEVEIDSHFPKKTNVEFIEIIGKDKIKMRVWERGSGETLACGTGACASVVATVLKGLTNRKVEVELLGGNLQIEWRQEDNHIYMTGPARTVFEGGFYDENK